MFQHRKFFVQFCLLDEDKKTHRPFSLPGSLEPHQYALVVTPSVTRAVPSCHYGGKASDDVSCSVDWAPTRKDVDGKDLPRHVGGFLFTFNEPIVFIDVEFCVHERPCPLKDNGRLGSEMSVISKLKKRFYIVDCARERGSRAVRTAADLPQLPVAKRRPMGDLSKGKSLLFFRHLRELSENGRWEKFQTHAGLFLSAGLSPDLRVFVMQESAVCHFFRGDLEAAGRTLDESFETLESCQTDNYNILLARGLATKSAVSRRLEDYPSCQEYIDTARQVMATTDCAEVLLKLEYNQAAMLTDKAGNFALYEPAGGDTEASLERCADLCQRSSHTQYEHLLMGIRTMVCRGQYLLKSCLGNLPMLPVSDEDMAKAKSSLVEAELRMLQNKKVGRRFEVRHKIALTDWHIRKRLFETGLTLSEAARLTANEYGMKDEEGACDIRIAYCKFHRKASRRQSVYGATTFVTTNSVDEILAHDEEEDISTKRSPSLSPQAAHSTVRPPGQMESTERCDPPLQQVSASSLSDLMNSVSPTRTTSGSSGVNSGPTSTPTRTPQSQHFSASHSNLVMQAGVINVTILNVKETESDSQ